jgi:DNA-binding GntR family transcriptional regulator
LSDNASKKTIQDAVYEQLKRVILDGYFRPGQRLVERELCEQLGVSRTPLREALKRLVVDGIVENEPYKGIIIPRLTVKQISDLVEIREVVEGLATRKAAERATKEDVEELKAIMRQAYELVENHQIRELVQLNNKFHQKINSMSGNEMIPDLIVRLQYRITLARSYSLYESYRPKYTLQEHDGIVKAIEDRNPEFAEELAKAHIRNGGKAAINAIKKMEDATIQPIR